MTKGDRIIFVDRDGVINKDPGGWTEHSYVTRWEDFHFLPGALEALRILKKFGFKEIDKANLPHKIWTDCIKCVKFPDCDETAMIKEI